jgi:hypothetical protein
MWGGGRRAGDRMKGEAEEKGGGRDSRLPGEARRGAPGAANLRRAAGQSKVNFDTFGGESIAPGMGGIGGGWRGDSRIGVGGLQFGRFVVCYEVTNLLADSAEVWGYA